MSLQSSISTKTTGLICDFLFYFVSRRYILDIGRSRERIRIFLLFAIDGDSARWNIPCSPLPKKTLRTSKSTTVYSSFRSSDAIRYPSVKCTRCVCECTAEIPNSAASGVLVVALYTCIIYCIVVRAEHCAATRRYYLPYKRKLCWTRHALYQHTYEPLKCISPHTHTHARAYVKYKTYQWL